MSLVLLTDAMLRHAPKAGDVPCHLSAAAASPKAFCADNLLLASYGPVSTGSQVRVFGMSCLPVLLRYLLVLMQYNMRDLRFGVAGQRIDYGAAGDILAAVGGMLRPWEKRAEGVSRSLAEQYGFGSDEVDDALRTMTNFVDAASFAFAHAEGDWRRFLAFLAEQFPHACQAAVPQHRSSEACVDPVHASVAAWGAFEKPCRCGIVQAACGACGQGWAQVLFNPQFVQPQPGVISAQQNTSAMVFKAQNQIHGRDVSLFV